MRKGQISIELLLAVVFILLLFVVVAIFANQKSAESDYLKTEIEMKAITRTLAANVNNIAQQGSGFYKYFRLPEQAHGYDYTVYFEENYVGIDTETQSYASELITGNVSVICIDQGYDKSNKVYNEEEYLYIICYRPELRVVNNSLHPRTASPGESVNLTFDVMNFGPEDAGTFRVTLNDTQTATVTSLASEEIASLSFPVTMPASAGQYNVGIRLDIGDAIAESIEDNNVFNDTVNVI